MKGEDIVTDILASAAQAVRDFVQRPEFAQLLHEALSSGGGLEQRIADSLAQQIKQQERHVRLVWGGADPYVPRRGPRPDDEKKQAALLEAQRTGRVAEAADRNGISRATLYRMLKR